MKKNMKQPIWKQLGFKQEFMDAVARNMYASLDLWWNGPPSSPNDVDNWAFFTYSDAMKIFSMALIDYTMPNPPLNDYYDVARRLVSSAIYYFFGPWRDNFKYLLRDFTRRQARTELPWIDCYRNGLSMAFCLGDWVSADKLFQWPGTDLPNDEGTDDRTSQDVAYHIWLASRMRGEPEKAFSKQRKLIEESTRRRPKLLLSAADALLANDAKLFAVELEKYLRHYQKREFTTDRTTDFGFCIEAAILWHIARRRKLELKAFPKDIDVFIPKP